MPIRNLKIITMPLREHEQRLHTLLHATPIPDAPLTAQPLAEQVKVFERIERGRIDRATADPAFVRDVEAAVEQIMRVLYQPLDGGPFIVPRDAWTRSPLMHLLASVAFWLYQDDLISMAEAARLLYDTDTVSDRDVARMWRIIERGDVRHYWIPGRAHKEGRAFLVRRSEVERLKQTLTD